MLMLQQTEEVVLSPWKYFTVLKVQQLYPLALLYNGKSTIKFFVLKSTF